MTSVSRSAVSVLGVTVVAMALACGGGQSGAVKSPTVRSPAVTAAPLSAWQKKGASTTPPASVINTSLDGIQLANQTAGAVTDQDARSWAGALVRTLAYDYWALNNLQDQFLQLSGLSSDPPTIFAEELTRIAQARANSARIQATRPTIRRMTLRPVAQSLQTTISAYRMSWSATAFYVDQIGPSDLAFVGADGGRNSVSADHVAAGQAVPLLVGGELLRDPVLGPVWSIRFDADCTSPSARGRLGSLCSP